MNSIKGTTSTLSEGNYVAPLTDATVNDAAYNLSLIKDACALAEMSVAQVVGQTGNHPWRQILAKELNGGGAGVGLPSGSDLYRRDGSPVKTVLSLGDVYTIGSNSVRLTKKSIEDIQRRKRMTYLAVPVYHYTIVDNHIYHTATAVNVQSFEYDRLVTYANMVAGDPLFPTSCIPMYIAGALATLLKEEEYATQAQFYTQQFAAMIQHLSQGFTTIDLMPIPAPIKGSEGQ